jgi:8-amino-7-oxononanoate synthase
MTQGRDVERTLVDWLGGRLGVDPALVDRARPLTAIGLDSVSATELNTMLLSTYGIELSPEQLFDGLTVDKLVEVVLTGPSPAARATAEQAPAPQAPKPVRESGPIRVPAPALSAPSTADIAAMQFSLLFFSSNASTQAPYRLLLDAARYGDEHDFLAVWVPERHFHTFGGIFPNPSVIASALAVQTDRIRIRAGSVVAPLHDPVRIAEEWSVVDNLSGGRVDIAFATGWNVDDFLFSPNEYQNREQVMLDTVESVSDLWTGGSVSRANGAGDDVRVQVLPRPVQERLPTWITCTSTEARFRQAGAMGANVLTALLFQDVEELARKIEIYRQARTGAGYDPATGRVTLMMHTYVGPTDEQVRAHVEAPFTRYLADSVDLWRRGSVALDDLDEAERRTVLSYAFERYYRGNALFGTPDGLAGRVEELHALGVDEIACLIDFGIPSDQVMIGLSSLDELRRRSLPAVPATSSVDGVTSPTGEGSLEDVVARRHALSHRNKGGVLAKARAFDLSSRLRESGISPYYTELTRNEGTTCSFEGRQLVMLGSNNYLGLTADDRVRRAVADAAMTEGPSLTGSRLLNGSTSAHRDMERRLAEFLGREDALLFTTGYQANIGLLSALMGDGTVLIVDDECHASVHDGAAVGGCTVVQFRHNDTDDLLRRVRENAHLPGMVMVDGVYSMSGDVAALPEISQICRANGLPLAVDDAHGLGTVGRTGRGIEEMLGAPGAADVLTGTFSKSLASVGGWVAGEHDVVEWIRYNGRSALFSAAIPPTALAAASTALEVLVEEPWRMDRLQNNAEYWRRGLRALGFDVANSRTAIVPIVVGDEVLCMRFARGLLDNGLYANCIIAPAVPAHRALIRTSVMATHEREQLDQALSIVADTGKEYGIIS